VGRGIKENNINLWHFRTFSTCEVASKRGLTSPFGEDLDDVVSVGRRRRRSAHTNCHNNVAATVVASASTKSVKRKPLMDESETYDDYDDVSDPKEHMRLMAEKRAQLGPLGSLIASSVEVGFSFANGYMSGGIMGYLGGAAWNIPGLFKNPTANGAAPAAPTAGGFKGVQRRIGDWQSKSFAAGKNWGQLSAAFSGFHVLTRVCRGGKEDRWNGIFGSALTGAYLSRQGGPEAMLKGASTYASFTYIMDMLGGGSQKKGGAEREFDYNDVPVEDRGY